MPKIQRILAHIVRVYRGIALGRPTTCHVIHDVTWCTLVHKPREIVSVSTTPTGGHHQCSRKRGQPLKKT